MVSKVVRYLFLLITQCNPYQQPQTIHLQTRLTEKIIVVVEYEGSRLQSRRLFQRPLQIAKSQIKIVNRAGRQNEYLKKKASEILLFRQTA